MSTEIESVVPLNCLDFFSTSTAYADQSYIIKHNSSLKIAKTGEGVIFSIVYGQYGRTICLSYIGHGMGIFQLYIKLKRPPKWKKMVKGNIS